MTNSQANQVNRVSRTNQAVGLRDIAKQMDVSVSTVSRALAGDGRISKKIINDVQCLSRSMGYMPKPLRRNVKNAFAVVVACENEAEIRQNYVQEAIYHVECCASELEYHLHIDFVDRGSEDLPSSVGTNRVDGVLAMGCPNPAMCKKISEAGIPIVVLDDYPSRVNSACVRVDTFAATQAMVSRLIQLGHQKIGAVVTKYSYPTVDERFQAFCSVFTQSGLTMNNLYLVSGVESNIVGGRRAVEFFQARGVMPTAIVFTNDWMALGGLLELQRIGLKVPQDVSIIGYDNAFICEETFPRITSINICLKQVIVKACDMLKSFIKDGKYEVVEEKISAKLIWRDSCDEPREKL